MFSNGRKTGSRETEMREEKGTVGEQDGLGTAAHTSQWDFRGTGYKCQLPYLKRSDCSGWCPSHCQGQQCQSEGHGGSGYTASEHETPEKKDQTCQWEACPTAAPQQGQDAYSEESIVASRSLARDEVHRPCCCLALPAQVHTWKLIRKNLKIGVFTAQPVGV